MFTLPDLGAPSRRSVKTERCAVESEVFLAHGANRGVPLKQSFEVSPNVGGAVSVSVQRDHAVSLCAAPQTPTFHPHLLLHLLPRATLAQTATARLARVSLGGG